MIMIWWSSRPIRVELQCFAALDNGLEVQTPTLWIPSRVKFVRWLRRPSTINFPHLSTEIVNHYLRASQLFFWGGGGYQFFTKSGPWAAKDPKGPKWVSVPYQFSQSGPGFRFGQYPSWAPGTHFPFSSCGTWELASLQGLQVPEFVD